jgi:flagellar assembly protein FliH
MALGALIDRIRRESRALILELAIGIAERILAKSIDEDPDWVLQNAESCLDHSVPNGPVRMRLHPRDRERILELDPPPGWMSSAGPVVLVADAELAPGDCVLESERARVDGRVEVQLQQLRTVLEDILAGAIFPEET